MGDDRARQIQTDIAEVLLRDWDPIGVAGAPEAQDEYDGYVGGVYRLLASGATAEAIANYLARLQTENMGLNTSAQKLLSVAAKLLALDISLKHER